MEELTFVLPVDVLLADDQKAPVLVVEGDRIVAANRAAEELLGLSPWAVGPMVEVFDETSRAKLERALAANRPGVWELQVTHRAQRPLPVRFLVVPNGQYTLWIAASCGTTYTDDMQHHLGALNNKIANTMRELARRTAATEAARVRLAEIGKLREQYIAMLSHDVRGPLGAINMQVMMMEHRLQTLAPEDMARRLRMIRTNVDRLLEMVTLVLDAARIEAGVMVLDRAPVALGDLAREVAQSFEPVATNAGLSIAVKRAAIDDVVQGDRPRLFQVLANFVDNAIRYAPAGSVITLDIVSSAETGQLRCRVRDEGPGVPPELHEAIFQRFRQTGGEARKGAAGLGLYIARQLAELHGGRIWVEDARPGALFVVELPRPRAA